MIEADQVFRSYTLAKKKIEVLRGVNLKIEPGEKVFLCGPSGAGKTTLMYTLAGLENPHEGRVLIDGTDFYQLSSGNQASLRNEKIGYIFQNYFLLPELTAIENVMVPGLIGSKLIKSWLSQPCVESVLLSGLITCRQNFQVVSNNAWPLLGR